MDEELIGSGRVSLYSPHFVGNRYMFPRGLCFCLVIKATSGTLLPVGMLGDEGDVRVGYKGVGVRSKE